LKNELFSAYSLLVVLSNKTLRLLLYYSYVQHIFQTVSSHFHSKWFRCIVYTVGTIWSKQCRLYFYCKTDFHEVSV